MQQRAFGRRPDAVVAPRHVVNARRMEPAIGDPLAVSGVTDLGDPEPSLEDELAAWKLERRRSLGLLLVPWRPLYLIASLSFGIASFALPDSINSWADWLLYALSAASLVVWFLGRRETATT